MTWRNPILSETVLRRVRKMTPPELHGTRHETGLRDLCASLLDELGSGQGTHATCSARWGEAVDRAINLLREDKLEQERREQAKVICAAMGVPESDASAVRDAVFKALVAGARVPAARAAGEAALDRLAERRMSIQVDASLRDLEKAIPRTLWPKTLDRALLPNPAAYDEAMEHTGSLWLYGPTGCAKTRAAAAIGVKAATEGERVVAWIASDLKAQIASMATTGEGNRRQLVDGFLMGNLSASDVLILDDAFQTFSTSFGEAVRRLLDYHAGRIIITSNYSPMEAAELRFREDLSKILPAVIRRLLDRCLVLNFGRQEGKP